MGNFYKILVVILCSVLSFITGTRNCQAQSTQGSYSITINTPGTFGQIVLSTVENWSDIKELTVSGQLNSSDMEYFSRLQNLTKLDLSNATTTTKSIGGCRNLKLLGTVILPQSIQKVEDYAFANCSALSSINLTQIREVGEGAFSYCRGLSIIQMPVVTKIGSHAFYSSDLPSVVIPNVEYIGEEAFYYCSKLTSIDIPNCTSIGERCFEYCEYLSSINLCDDLEVIYDNTFSHNNFKSIKLPSKLKRIGYRAFWGCNLTSIEIPEGVLTLEGDAFDGCI